MQRAAPERAPEAHRLSDEAKIVDCTSCRRPVVDQGILADPKMRESRADTMQGLSSAMSWSSAAHRVSTHVEITRLFYRLC